MSAICLVHLTQYLISIKIFDERYKMKLSPAFFYLLPLGSKHSPQYSDLYHILSVYNPLLNMSTQVSQHARQQVDYSFAQILIFTFLDRRYENTKFSTGWGQVYIKCHGTRAHFHALTSPPQEAGGGISQGSSLLLCRRRNVTSSTSLYLAFTRFLEK
jgi:hypothetical protein